MEPDLVTDPKLLDVLNELKEREPIFHRPEFGTTRADFEKMTETTFWEVGGSGQRYSREQVLNELEKRFETEAEDSWQTCDFHCLEIGGDNLPSYLYADSGRPRHSTVYHLAANG
jgi:hypothetical protein